MPSLSPSQPVPDESQFTSEVAPIQSQSQDALQGSVYPAVDFRNVFGDVLTLEEKAERGRKCKNSENFQELNRFFTWLKKYGPPDVTEHDVMDNVISSAALDYVLAMYLDNRYNLTAYRQVKLVNVSTCID